MNVDKVTVMSAEDKELSSTTKDTLFPFLETNKCKFVNLNPKLLRKTFKNYIDKIRKMLLPVTQ